MLQPDAARTTATAAVAPATWTRRVGGQLSGLQVATMRGEPGETAAVTVAKARAPRRAPCPNARPSRPSAAGKEAATDGLQKRAQNHLHAGREVGKDIARLDLVRHAQIWRCSSIGDLFLGPSPQPISVGEIGTLQAKSARSAWAKIRVRKPAGYSSKVVGSWSMSPKSGATFRIGHASAS